jgi:hypothetical protein
MSLVEEKQVTWHSSLSSSTIEFAHGDLNRDRTRTPRGNVKSAIEYDVGKCATPNGLV